VPLERCSPSPVVDIIKADIAADSYGSEKTVDAVARAAGTVLGYSNAKGSR
jgi:hypothetical protein